MNLIEENIARKFLINDGRPINANNPDGGGIAFEIGVSIYETTEELYCFLNLFETNTWAHWNQNNILIAKNEKAKVIENVIQNNLAYDDGGGIYASVMANVNLVSNMIRGNRAYNNGGAIRITMGSNLELNNDIIRNNKCNNQINPDAALVPVDEESIKSGGGGIAARNSSLILNNVTIEDNVCPGFAGGGIYFISSESGYHFDMLGYIQLFPFMWVIHRVYEYTEAKLVINGGTIDGNITSDTTAGAQGRDDKGKGGGIYILRYSEALGNPSGDPDKRILGIKLEISPSSVIGTPVSPPQNRNQATYPNSNRIYLDNKERPDIVTDNEYPPLGSELPFNYEEAMQ